MLIDSHCHLETYIKKGILKTVLKNAHEENVQEYIAVGTHSGDWHLYRDLAQESQSIHWTVGLHPCYVEEDYEDQITQISSFFIDSPAPVALGEIGLDYFHLPKDKSEQEACIQHQQAAFQKQLNLALQFDCPIIIHSRNAFAECVAMIDKSGLNWKNVVFHCFSEGPEEIKILNNKGGRGSFTGIITYKNAENVRQAMLEQGLDLLMIETDAPYLSPTPHRGKMNQPSYLSHTAAMAANLFGIEESKLEAICETNTRKFFSI